jgi:hypothetical protein
MCEASNRTRKTAAGVKYVHRLRFLHLTTRPYAFYWSELTQVHYLGD